MSELPFFSNLTLVFDIDVYKIHMRPTKKVIAWYITVVEHNRTAIMMNSFR
jgi:hypothetical protein